jgi:hypothetical protein
MAWNLPNKKPLSPDGKKPTLQQRPALWLQYGLQQLNCFADKRFHPLRFAVLFLLLLTVVAVVRDPALVREGVSRVTAEVGGSK